MGTSKTGNASSQARLARLERGFRRRLQRAGSVIWAFRGESLALRAGNLTFISVTSMVPLLAVALSLLRTFQGRFLQDQLSRFVRDVLAPGIQDQSAKIVDSLFRAAASRPGSTFSFVLLLVSGTVLFRHLDAALNDVWDVQRKRGFWVSAGLYAGLLVFGPLFLALALAGTNTVKRFVLREIPWAPFWVTVGAAFLVVGALTLLYRLAPRAPVPWKSAFIGAVVAGTSWEVARYGYGAIAGYAYGANSVYGSLSVVPLFLMWLYVSWYLVLVGARLSFAVDHAEIRRDVRSLLDHPQWREWLGAHLARLITEAFLGNGRAPTTRWLAQHLRIPEKRIQEVVDRLLTADLLVIDAGGQLRPARDPTRLTLADIATVFGRGTASSFAQLIESTEGDGVTEALRQSELLALNELARTTWESLTKRKP